MNIHPNNKKSNYTTQFNTPIILDGNYEVALANITCTPNIRMDYGSIIFKNLREFYLFLPEDFKLRFELFDVKNIEDKINNELQQQITFFQFMIHNTFFSMCERKTFLNTEVYKDLLPVFYYYTEQYDSNSK